MINKFLTQIWALKFRIIFWAAIFILLPFSASPAEERGAGGEVSATGALVEVGGERAKFNEYRDLRDGIYGQLDLRYEAPKYELRFEGADIGYRTQHFGLEGVRWGSFRFHLAYDETPHNFTSGAKTFYSGLGGDRLTFPLPAPSPEVSTWGTFGYDLARKKSAGGFRLDLLQPFFFDFSLSREEKKGLYPVGLAGTDPGGMALELPEAVDQGTNDLQLAVGYSRRPFFLALTYAYSAFENDKERLQFGNPATENTAATTDTFTRPPDNIYYQFGLQGVVQFPLHGRLHLNWAYSRTESGAPLLDSYVADVPAQASNIGLQGRRGFRLDAHVFNGKLEIHNYGLALTISPLSFLDGKLFYQFYKTDHNSRQVITTDPAANLIEYKNELFDYWRERQGGELEFKLPAHFSLIGRYIRVETRRERADIPKTNEDTFAGELRWSGLNFLVARASYERTNQKAEFQEGPVVASPTDPQNLFFFLRRFDGASFDRNRFRTGVDLFPGADLDLSLEFRYSDTNYKDSALGLQRDKRSEFLADLGYLISRRVKLTANFSYERGKLDQFQKQLPSPTTLFDPADPPTPEAFSWTLGQTTRTYGYGLGAEIYLIPKRLTLRLQYNSLKADGSADYTYLLGTIPLPAGRTQENIDIDHWDDYRVRSYVVNLTYRWTSQVSLAAGFAYEKYIYDDAQVNGYAFVPATAGTNGAFLTGAYRDPSYRAGIFFLTASFKL